MPAEAHHNYKGFALAVYSSIRKVPGTTRMLHRPPRWNVSQCVFWFQARLDCQTLSGKITMQPFKREESIYTQTYIFHQYLYTNSVVNYHTRVNSLPLSDALVMLNGWKL